MPAARVHSSENTVSSRWVSPESVHVPLPKPVRIARCPYAGAGKDGAAEFLRGYGGRLGRPNAILVVSAHWETDVPSVGTTPAPETIYDFRGFSAELYRMRYAAPGAPELAERAAELVEAEMGGPSGAIPGADWTTAPGSRSR